MAWSTADVGATELALMALDKPIISAANALYDADAVEWSAAGSFAGADITLSGYPIARAYDGHTHLQTKPNAAATTQYLLFNLDSAATDIDFIAIMGHNFGTIGGLTVTAEISDVSTFSGADPSTKEIASWSPGSSNDRLIELELNHSGSGSSNAQRYSTVPYFRLKMTKVSSFTPAIGEIILGRRRQLKHAPNMPWDDKNLSSEVRRTTSVSGVVTQYVFHKGRRELEANFNPHEVTYKDQFETWFKSDAAFGTRPFIWIDEPSTSPEAYHLMVLEPEFQFPGVGPHERNYKIKAVEQGPHFLALES